MVLASNTALYKQDYHLWLEATIHQLRERDLESLDWHNLIEELEAMGRSDKRAILSNLRVLLRHLLKWKYQPDKRSNSWNFTIIEHRTRIEDELTDSPSLKSYVLESIDRCYKKAKVLAATETSLPLNTFPSDCPFTAEEVLNPDYLPE